MRLLMLAVLLCAAVAAWGNDCWVVGAGGRVRRVAGEQPSIRMVREAVQMDIYPEYYTVAVQFEFHNDGPATTVTMGFPERGYGDIAQKNYRATTGYRQFRTWVDGAQVTATRKPATILGEGEEYNTYWVKTVSFAKGQTRIVRVEYRSPAGNVSTGELLADYDFTGGNWKGAVQESTLRVTCHLPGAYVVDPGIPMDRTGATLSTRWTNWQAEYGFEVSYQPTRTDAMALRGGKAASWWTSSTAHILVSPGTAPDITPWAPPVIEKQGVPCIALAAVTELLNRAPDGSALAPEDRKANATWDAASHEATFTDGTHTLRFQLKEPLMRIAGGADIPLPIGPFLSLPVQCCGEKRSFLYVPVEPLAAALGGSATIDRTAHTVTLKLPAVQKTATVRP